MQFNGVNRGKQRLLQVVDVQQQTGKKIQRESIGIGEI